ncbi:MAG TPA: stage II sporulation protein D [Ruminococcus sp.]|nr:stage II sporulation protein D [Ruminococcus sp.]HCR73490.1 stage II sporulation protein D [Ruminococcus sp.]
MKNYLCIIAVFALLMTAIPAISFRSSAGSDSSEISQQTTVVTDTAADEKSDIFLVLDINSGQILEITEKDYVIGAVCAEMPASFNIEALKAQAVAAHTYAVRQRENELKNPTPELCGAYISDDSSKYQAFLSEEQAKQYFGDNFNEYYSKISEAVDSVSDEILVYNDEPIVAAFHSVSSGKTESAENIFGSPADYLVSVESIEDINAPEYLKEYTFTSDEISARLKETYPDIQLSDDKDSWLSVKKRTASDTVISLDAGNINMSGWEFRNIFSLRSAAFDIVYENGIFTISTKGCGHGVGMSQYGAEAMAKQGASYDEILKHYYKGAEIKKIPS